MRVVIAARDVSLVRSPQQDTSILNVLPATVVEVSEDGPSQAMVRLECGEQTLLARVTRKSVHEMGLAPGEAIYAQVKSVALLS